MTAARTSPRDRYREQTRAEIKAVALRQLAEGGAGAVALTRIAREVGLSGPALYRYFANRDDLLSSLIQDAYDDAATAVGSVGGQLPSSPRTSLRLLADAYLGWAAAQPHRYLLIQGSPLPGYSAPADTTARARAVLGPFLRVFATGEPDEEVRPLVAELAAWAHEDEAAAAWLREYTGLEPEDDRAATALAGAILAWSQLHGTVSLEVSGQYAGMGHRARTLLTCQMSTLAATFRLPDDWPERATD
ncbi:TetR/AcrR family transcriptional regulator [Streptomyces smyrnaeus]|uniref:TetR/AcrR family transcriptional regulator n=1 Tax=Streptomyces smyrnaeus TaxID=1387713 RepID=UPI0033BB41A8